MSKRATLQASVPGTPNSVSKQPPYANKFVLLIFAVHLLIALGMTANYLSHRAIPGDESAIAQFAYQAGEGLPLYGQYDVHVQELWYTPFAIQTAGFFGKWFGYDIRALRFVVACYGFGSIFLVGLITRRFTGSTFMSVVAAGIFSAIPAPLWFVYFTHCVNAGLTFFVLLSVYILVRNDKLSWPAVLGATLTLFLAYWSKQTGLAYLAAGIAFFCCKDFKKGIVAAILGVLLVAGTAYYYQLPPNGTYFKSTFLHANHPMIWRGFFDSVLPEYTGRFGVLFAAVIAGFAMRRWTLRELIKPEYVFLSATALVGTVTSLKYGSGLTQSMPFYGILICLGLTMLHNAYRDGRLAGVWVSCLLTIQGLALVNNLTSYIITKQDDDRFDQILKILATPGKSTYYNVYGFFNYYVGKPVYSTVGRDCWYKGRYDVSRYPQFFRDYYSKDPFDLVLIGVPLEDNSWFLYQRLNANYVPVQELPAYGPECPYMDLRRKKLVLLRKDQLPQNKKTE